MRPFITSRCKLQRKPAQLATFLVIACLMGACAKDQETESRLPEPGEAVQYASPELAILEMYVGIWTVAENHFDVSGEIVATVNGTERNTWILDNHAIQRVYTSGAAAAVYHAMGMFTWNTAERKYGGVWLDNVSATGPLEVTADWTGKDLTMTYALESFAKDGTRSRHRVVERFADKERRTATTYRLSGEDGEGVKVLEIEYRRATPCPGGALRVIGELSDRPGK